MNSHLFDDEQHAGSGITVTVISFAFSSPFLHPVSKSHRECKRHRLASTAVASNRAHAKVILIHYVDSPRQLLKTIENILLHRFCAVYLLQQSSNRQSVAIE